MKPLLLFFFISFSMIAFAQDIKLKLASDVWPPFTNTPENKAFAIDLVRESLRRTGTEVVNEIVDFTNAIHGIEQGVYHGSSAVWKDNEREKYMAFS
ncbi:MAG TPA: hypothetical protein VFU05_13530, partial [Cyclobacteriaceae bacterium]|nr:hypothetical protein [Cyclobacteriaceae bacterium]